MCPAHVPGLENWIAVARATGLFFQTPSQHLSSFFHLGFGNIPSVLEAVEEGAWLCLPQLLCCALGLCSAPVHLNLLSQIVFATNWSLGALAVHGVPFAKQGANGNTSLVRSVHHLWLLWREQEGVGATPQGGLCPSECQGSSTAQLLYRGPSQPCEVALAAVQVITPGFSLCSLFIAQEN